MTTYRTNRGCTVTTTFARAPDGRPIEHVELEVIPDLKLVEEIREKRMDWNKKL